MISIPYAHFDDLTGYAKRTLTIVAHEIYPNTRIRLERDPDSPLLSPKALQDYPVADQILKAQMLRMFDMLPQIPEDVLFLDIETHGAEKRWDMPRGEFFRLGQYAWGEGPVQVTTSLVEVLSEMSKARRVIAHNGHAFDFSVLLGNDALHWTHQGRLFDTWTHASVKVPMPVTYEHSNGRTYTDYSVKPSNARRWYGLDNMAYQFGIEGKMGDLKELAARHNPPKTKVADLDFGLIPIDDPDFLAYAKQDIVVLREFTRSMLAVLPIDEYDKRAQFTAAIDAQMSRNGVRLDEELARTRVQVAEENKQRLLDELVDEYDFPTEGKMPWRTKVGKDAIMKILADAGITPESHPNWVKTATGNPSLGGDALVELTAGTSVEELGSSLAALQGQRPLAEQALTYLSSDGRVHPDIDALQRSGRRSVTQPGLTTWGSRTEVGAREKEYFVASKGHKLLEVDLSNADQRAVAFMSKDKEYAKRFLPGVDGHEISGRLMFGDKVYDSDPAAHRNVAKACIAAGELVYTDRGMIPIELVLPTDMVHDGFTFVNHGGVVLTGYKEVIYYDGLWATRDHQVFVQDGDNTYEVPFGLAATEQLPLVKAGPDPYGISVRDDRPDRQQQGQPLQPRSRKIAVYDIQDAGPHHRYAVSGRLVHNCSHGYAYGAGPKKLAATSGQPLEMAQRFVDAMERAYPRMIQWQHRVRQEGGLGWVTNLWGRKMPVQDGKAYTQAPALIGQSSTTELLYDTLINLYEDNPHNLQYVLFPVHDALLCEVPEELAEDFAARIVQCADQTINGIEIIMEAGTPAQNWMEAMH